MRCGAFLRGVLVALSVCLPPLSFAAVGPLEGSAAVMASSSGYAWRVIQGGSASGAVRLSAGAMARTVAVTLAPLAVRAVVSASLYGVAAAGAWYLYKDVQTWMTGRSIPGQTGGQVVVDPYDADRLLVQQGGSQYFYQPPADWPGLTGVLHHQALPPVISSTYGSCNLPQLTSYRMAWKGANCYPNGDVCCASGTWGTRVATGWKLEWQGYGFRGAGQCNTTCGSCPQGMTDKWYADIGCGYPTAGELRPLTQADVEELVNQGLPDSGTQAEPLTSVVPELLEQPLTNTEPEWAQVEPEPWIATKDAMADALGDAIAPEITALDELTPEEYLGTTAYTPNRDLEEVRQEIEQLPPAMEEVMRKIEAEREAAFDGMAAPSDQVFDPAVEAPDKTLLAPILDGAKDTLMALPFVSYVAGMQVQASGSPVLTASMYGKTITVDFSKWESTWVVCGNLLLLFCQIAAGRKLIGGGKV